MSELHPTRQRYHLLRASQRAVARDKMSYRPCWLSRSSIRLTYRTRPWAIGQEPCRRPLRPLAGLSVRRAPYLLVSTAAAKLPPSRHEMEAEEGASKTPPPAQMGVRHA